MRRFSAIFLSTLLILLLFLADIASEKGIAWARAQFELYLPLVYNQKTLTPTITLTPSRTPTRTLTRSPNWTPTRTFTPFRTFTPIPTSTVTPTITLTPTSTFTSTNTPTTTYLPVPEFTLSYPTETSTIQPTRALSPTASLTQTPAIVLNVTQNLSRLGILGLVCLVWSLLAIWLFFLLRRSK